MDISMSVQWEEALQQVKKLINEKIAADPFPEKIRPGLLREAVRLYPMRGGKRIRPALVLWCCGAAGGDPAKALNAAAAAEIYHNWTLVHDDIIDCDDVRRGKPTTHRDLETKSASLFDLDEARAHKYGTSMAILAGDLQQAWAMDMLLRSTEECSLPQQTVMILCSMMQSFLSRELISGEALDVEFEFRKDFPDLAETEEMIAGKTGALLSFSAKTGAVAALGKEEHPFVRSLGDFAMALGNAFQLCDDLLGVYGDEKTFGKPLCSDFREGKPTILLAEAIKRGSDLQKEKLLSLLHLSFYAEKEIGDIRFLLEETGAKAAAEERASHSTEKALSSLMTLPESGYRTTLLEMTAALLKRKI